MPVRSEPLKRRACHYGLSQDLTHSAKRCRERVEAGSILCARHRAEGLARVYALIASKLIASKR